MKKITLIVISLIGFYLSSCGGGETGCLEACGHTFLKADNQCAVAHRSSSSDKSACTNKALSEAEQCEAKCYGNP